MAERITIMLDSEVAKKLRTKQSKAIAKLQKSVSFSKIINETLSEVL